MPMSSDNLKQQRTQLGLTQAGLAARLKVAANTVARWERGELALPPFLGLALETVAAQIEIERGKRGPGRPRRKRPPAPASSASEDA